MTRTPRAWRVGATLLGLLVAVSVLGAGCTQTQAVTSGPQEGESRASDATLQAQFNGLQRLVGFNPDPTLAEPEDGTAEGRYIALIEDVSLDASAPAMTLDLVTPDHSDEFSIYKNLRVSSQKFALSPDAVIVVRNQDWAEPVETHSGSPAVVVSYRDFARHWKSDAGQGPMRGVYFVTIRDGEIVSVEQRFYE